MLTIRTILRKSKVCDGIGAFSLEIVGKGQTIWEYHPFFTRRMPKWEWDVLDPMIRSRLDEHDCYWHDSLGHIMIPLDNDRFVNHSLNPNMVSVGDDLAVAARDIQAGDELTMDYRTIIPKEQWQPWYFTTA
jgi:SET domain-containing protein